ncbi:cytidine deaminase-like protein [Myxozyma melibiosi]|uniref:Cytidine deaminase-like protein n=1 Tax=Myxozyma melibiosi TaxID=54550 RepID=A0ABR1F3Z0_9ASCO
MDELDRKYMSLALEQADKCIGTPTAFCVGAVIVLPRNSDGNSTSEDIVLSTGYSRELPGNTHAEQCALEKLTSSSSLPPPRSAVIYTTMEPCSERLSGNLPCADRIIDAGIFKCVKVGVLEPDTFVKHNVGREKLLAAGIEYVHVPGFEQRCLEIAERGH